MTTKPATHGSASRPTAKASYRTVQAALVVASFVASFAGALWLHTQDMSLAANRATGTAAETSSAKMSGVELSGTVISPAVMPELRLEPIPEVVTVAPVSRLPRAVARSRSSR